MKRFSPMFLSWWYTAAAPVRTSMTTLTEREYERKRRLLSIVLLSALVLITLSTAATSLTSYVPQTFLGWIESCLILLALWLNRRGYLQLACLTFFLNVGCNLFLAALALSFPHPLSLLWTLSPLALLMVMAGLFLPAWIIVLMALAESLLLVWYLLIERRDQFSALLTSQEYGSFLVYLVGVMFASAVIGAFYSSTTRKALMQADRAVELEQAHDALSEVYRNLAEAHIKLEAAHATIQKQALTDGMTGLPNHRAVMDQLSKELDRARRYDRPFSLLFFDTDRFKQVNDTYGHATGDAVLREICERAGTALRGGDTLGRFGGEEFVILLPEADAREAGVVAERIRASIATGAVAPSEVEGGIIMTVSIGLSTYPTDGASEQDLLSQADAAMYVAKRLGRNQVRTAAEAKQVEADLELMALLHEEGQREAVQREGLTPGHLKETYTLRMVYSLLSLLERRDQSMGAHAHTVSDLTTAMAQEMGLASTHVSRVAMAALVHDIGKVAVPDVILQKAGHLSAHERTLLREHAELGAQILEASPFLQDLAPAVRYHHEHWDGNGYPHQFAGEHIPLEARLIAVAEAYDAMLRKHPYQASCSPAEAMAELRRCAGTQFDPAVVQLLLTLLPQQSERQQTLPMVG